MSTPYPAEKRLHVRVPQSVKVRFRFIEGPSGAQNVGYVDAVTRDISEGGCFIELGKESRLRDDAIGNFILFKGKMELEISLAGRANLLHVIGKAVWIEKKVKGHEEEYCRGVAVQFMDISPENVARIRDFVASVLDAG